jgi:hypothetical protein
MRRTLTIAALVVALCCPAFAGEMHTPVVTPPPPANTIQAEPVTGGESETEATEAADGLTETVLSLLETVLALF